MNGYRRIAANTVSFCSSWRDWIEHLERIILETQKERPAFVCERWKSRSSSRPKVYSDNALPVSTNFSLCNYLLFTAHFVIKKKKKLIQICQHISLGTQKLQLKEKKIVYKYTRFRKRGSFSFESKRPNSLGLVRASFGVVQLQTVV